MLLSNYPARLPVTAAVLPYLTVIKRVASLISLVVPLVLFAIMLVRKGTRPSL